MKRVEDLKKMSPETRPEWCPEVAVLSNSLAQVSDNLAELVYMVSISFDCYLFVCKKV